MSELLKCRDAFVGDVERQLFGPADGPTESITGQPFWRYLAGMLFPGDADEIRHDAESEPAATSGDESDPAVSAAYDRLPSSMGVSFLVRGVDRLTVSVEAARYESSDHQSDEGGRDGGADGQSGGRHSGPVWKRRPLGTADDPVVATIEVPDSGEDATRTVPIMSGAAELVAVFRPRREGHLATVTLVNRSRPSANHAAAQVEATLFQCRFHVATSSKGAIVPYPRSEAGPTHEEDEELNLVYRNRRSYGIGHGCAATWDLVEGRSGSTQTICADPLPHVEVHGMTNRARPEHADDQALAIAWLADEEVEEDSLRSGLTTFVSHYEEWVDRQDSEAPNLSEDQPAARRIVERQRRAIARMKRGIETLTGGDPNVLAAFRLAQRAILGQFLWRDRQSGGPFDSGTIEGLGPSDDWARGPVGGPHRWHPFQLGFQLLVLESIASTNVPERELVDLLWFPTGGGKTEAYLAVAALEMFLRRLRYRDDGTAVVMRYTLRLLTSQQFERCAGLISAMEILRRSRADDLGDSPFRLGLWVGEGLTPNRLDSDSERAPGARQRFEAMLDAQDPDSPFLIRSCPRCGTRLVPRVAGPRDQYGFDVTASKFRAFCPDERCALHSSIPVSVVDDDLYRRPPTFVIGTIDKFARLAWDARPRVMFGTRDPERLPPSLVIQDELHLITGPLGTIAGVYEAGLETVFRQGGSKPKYLASTATIQRADEQCMRLYGRSAFVFPPSGLDADDSYFSRVDVDTPGRTFVGVMGTGPYSSLTTLVQVSAAAAYAAGRVSDEMPRARDTYWTQVIYHNSRKELGKTTTMLRDDVKTRLEMLQAWLPDEEHRDFESVEELSANLKGSEVGRALERLAVSLPHADAVDAVACTNMLSVGVDVSRLGLMIMKGQPKTTAEYIQATSRVGRDTRKRPPGIVVTLYSPYRPRDRSHFEGFQTFHGALYRAVEPSSVTPYSEPARRRTLHAALVVAMRLCMGWEEGREASLFAPDTGAQDEVIEELRERIARACGDDDRRETMKHFDDLLEEWEEELEKAERAGVSLTFDVMPQMQPLLDHFPRSRGGGHWPTLNSMRHVDGETPFSVRGAV